MESKISKMIKINGLNSTDRYYLTSVDTFKKSIKKNVLGNISDKKIYKKNIENISYSLKYLEFLDLQLRELVLDDSMKKIIYKNFIIISMEIVNAVLYLNFKINKLDEQVKLNLYNKIKYIKKENMFENISEELEHLRGYRNKVHLIIESEKIMDNEEETSNNTDWYAFNEEEYNRARKVLRILLLNNQEDSNFDFLI